MANKYLRSTDGSDADDGSTWALADQTMTAAAAAATSSDRLWVSNNHAESLAGAIAITFPTTPGLEVLCGDDAAEPPTALAGPATVTTTGANQLSIISGHAYIYGVSFVGANGASAVNLIILSSGTLTGHLIMDTCKLSMTSTNTGNRIIFGANSSSGLSQMLELINTTVRFGASAQALRPICTLTWRDTAGAIDVAGTAPASLFKTFSNSGNPIELIAVDLVLVTGALVDVTANGGIWLRAHRCIFGSGMVLRTGTWFGQQQGMIEAYECMYGSTRVYFQLESYNGNVISDTGIYLSGGSVIDAVPVSCKMVSTAGSSFYSPLTSVEFPFIYDGATGSAVTVEFEIVNDGTTFDNNDIWASVWPAATASSSFATRASSRVSNVLATPSAYSTTSVTWVGTGGFGAAVKQKLTVTFTPQVKGVYKARVMLATASKTVYVDMSPRGLGITSTQWVSPDGNVVSVPTAAAGGGQGISQGLHTISDGVF